MVIDCSVKDSYFSFYFAIMFILTVISYFIFDYLQFKKNPKTLRKYYRKKVKNTIFIYIDMLVKNPDSKSKFYL